LLLIGRSFGVLKFHGSIWNPRFIFVLVLCAGGEVMHAHGLYQTWPNIPSICSSLAITIFYLVLIGRLFNKIFKNDDDIIQGLLKTTITFYEQEEQIPEHRPVLLAKIKFLQSLIIYFLVFSLLIVSIPNPTAWIVSWYTGELTLVSPVYLPFTDPKTLFWYTINSAILTFFTLLLFTMFMAYDVLYIFFVYQTVPMVEIYCMKVRKFGEKLIQAKTEKMVNHFEPSTSTLNAKGLWNHAVHRALENKKAKKIAIVEQNLVTLIKEFNVYNEYVQAILVYLELPIFASMSLISMAIAMAIVVTLYYSKAIGGVMVIFLFSLVFTPCVQGTLILHQKEKILDEICAFPWYELSNRKQKMFLQLIHLAQNSTELTVPIVGDIDMELFTDVMNGGYSYFNYLYNFVGDL
jgi:hypothetical protein